MENTIEIKLDDYVQKIELISEFRYKTIEQEKIIKAQSELIKKLQKYVFEENLITYLFDKYDLEELLNENSYNFAIKDRKQLMLMGISLDEIKAYIKDRYTELQGNK